MRSVKSRRNYNFIAICLTMLLSGFLIYSSTIGNHNITSLNEQKLRIAILNAQLRDMTEERIKLEKKVQLLQPHSLDPDMLEERARDMLNIVHPNDIIISR